MTLPYDPEPLPTAEEGVTEALEREHARIASSLNTARDLDVTRQREVAKPQEGWLRYFRTGVYDPGQGTGLYVYQDNQWRRLSYAQTPTGLVGFYNQVTDTIRGGGNLDPASNYAAGQYYILEVTGTFSTPIAELNGLSGAAGDRIISSGTQWILLSAAQDFLSSVADDTAQGVITFVPAPRSNTAATAAAELTRKQEVDAGDEAVQANLDTHTGHLYNSPDDPHGISGHVNDADIHFPDAPADGDTYGRQNNAWVPLAAEIAVLYGAPDSFTLGTGVSPITNYGNLGSSTPDIVVDDANGSITINENGVYSLSCGLVGIQGNDTKEEDIYLWLQTTAGPDVEMWSYHVGTDKGANYRSLGRTLVVAVTTAPVTLNLAMQATAGLGTFTFVNANLAINRMRV